jgi:hypothetical protein
MMVSGTPYTRKTAPVVLLYILYIRLRQTRSLPNIPDA